MATRLHIARSVLMAATVGLALAVAAPGAWAHGVIPRHTPVDRIVANLTAYIQAHPDDADGYYRLGRTHYLAMATRLDMVAVMERDGTYQPAEGSFSPGVDYSKQAKAIDEKKAKEHLAEAIRNLNKAIELRPTEPKYFLTLACALESGAPLRQGVDAHPLSAVKVDPVRMGWWRKSVEVDVFNSISAGEARGAVQQFLAGGGDWLEVGTPVRDYVIAQLYPHRDDPKCKALVRSVLDADWDRQVGELYFRAMTMALPDDGKIDEKPVWGGLKQYVAYEAAQNFVRVTEGAAAAAKQPIRLSVAKATVKGFDGLPHPSAITPIVFSLSRPARGLTDLLQGEAAPVSFDLDGSGLAQPWSWVTPQTGILCWDPTGSGKITSGHQLFGSVSWRLFFDDGYQALDLLDDDRDGRLAGKELAGISVWFDRDSDGVSDAGEVVTVASLGVAAIACRATGVDAGCPANHQGLTLKDGTILPTFDWVATRRSANDGRPSP